MPIITFIISGLGWFVMMSSTPFDSDAIGFAMTLTIIGIVLALAVIFNAQYTKKLAIISLILGIISLSIKGDLDSTRNSSYDKSPLTTSYSQNGSKNTSVSADSTPAQVTPKKEDRSTYIAKCGIIDYKSLARNPNLYKGNNYAFTGQVVQVLEDYNKVTLRVNVTQKKYDYIDKTYYTDTILVDYQYSSSNESRILENDMINFYGKSMGTKTYQSVFGEAITIPYISAMYIDIR